MVMSGVLHKAFLYPKPNTYDTKKRGADDEEFWRQDSKDLRGLVAAGDHSLSFIFCPSRISTVSSDDTRRRTMGGAVTVFQKYS
jgi:hypothetical protein